MKNELLLGASILALIELNSGYVEAQPVIVTVGTGCPGGCTYPDPQTAFTALSGNYSNQTFDVQIQPGNYQRAGWKKLDFNGTVEGMGTIASNITLGNGSVVSTTAPGVVFGCYTCGSGQPQAYLTVGTEASPYPGVNLVLKNFEMDGTITSNSTGATVSQKQKQCIQTQAIGNVLVENVVFINCQDGIIGDPWTPTDGSGILLLSNSVWQNNCSSAGPSHGFYIQTGSIAVGAVTVTMQGQTITGTANTFGECNAGYNNKSRAPNTTIKGNYYYMNFGPCASSGAIDIPNGGTLDIENNIQVFGSVTGLPTCGQSSNPAQGILLGAELGDFQPSSWTIAGNTQTLVGVTKKFTSVSNLQNLPGTFVISNNTLPLASALNNVLQGLGTIGTGNVYADSSPVTPAVQNTLIQGLSLVADYRGMSGPQSVTMTGVNGHNGSAWGGNGVLTATLQTGSYGANVAGGPGGMVLSTTGPAAPNLWFWTAPNSTNTININAQFNGFTFGTDTINLGNYPGVVCNSGTPIVVEEGTTTVNINTSNIGTLSNPTCKFYTQNTGTLIVNSQYHTSANSDISFSMYPGSVATLAGSGVRPGGLGTNATFIEQSYTAIPSTGSPVIFDGTISGGGFSFGPIATAANGLVTVISGWAEGSFESSTGSPIAIRHDPVSINYTASFAGGGTVYAGIDKVTLSGSTRSLGPPPRIIALHVQEAAAGTTMNSGPGAFQAYLDGSGVVTASRANAQNQSDYVEIDPGGNGTVTVAQAWRPSLDKCGLGQGVTQTGSTVAGGATTLTFSTGGKAIFQGTTSGVVCNSVSITPSPLMFVQSTPLIANVPVGAVVGSISGGVPPYSVVDTTHFTVSGNNLDAKIPLPAATYNTNVSDSAP